MYNYWRDLIKENNNLCYNGHVLHYVYEIVFKIWSDISVKKYTIHKTNVYGLRAKIRFWNVEELVFLKNSF